MHDACLARYLVDGQGAACASQGARTVSCREGQRGMPVPSAPHMPPTPTSLHCPPFLNRCRPCMSGVWRTASQPMMHVLTIGSLSREIHPSLMQALHERRVALQPPAQLPWRGAVLAGQLRRRWVAFRGMMAAASLAACTVLLMGHGRRAPVASRPKRVTSTLLLLLCNRALLHPCPHLIAPQSPPPTAVDALAALPSPSAAARSFTSAPQALGAAIGTAAIVAIIASETKRRWAVVGSMFLPGCAAG